MTTVFISHASEAADIAEDLYHALEHAGYTAYLDKKALAIGQEYNLAIRDLVARSDFFVFLISPESIQHGAYALTEVQYAEEKWRKQPECVVPVMLREVNSKALPAFLRQITYLTPKGNATAEVVSEINRRSLAEVRSVDRGRADRVARAKGYFERELDGRAEWYAKASKSNSRRSLTAHFMSITCAVTISLLSILDAADWVRHLIALLTGLLVYATVWSILGDHSVKAFGYRMLAERMERERRKYSNFTAPYTAGLGENRAYELFVETIEQILEDERRT